MAHSAKDQAIGVKDEAIAQARDVYGEARRQLTEHADAQAQQVGSGLRQLGHELDRMAGSSTDHGIGARLVQEAAQRAHQAATFVEGRQVGDMLDDLRALARRRPGAFLLGAAGLGLLAGRLGRGARDAQHDDTPSTAAASWATREPYPAHPAPMIDPIPPTNPAPDTTYGGAGIGAVTEGTATGWTEPSAAETTDQLPRITPEPGEAGHAPLTEYPEGTGYQGTGYPRPGGEGR